MGRRDLPLGVRRSSDLGPWSVPRQRPGEPFTVALLASPVCRVPGFVAGSFRRQWAIDLWQPHPHAQIPALWTVSRSARGRVTGAGCGDSAEGLAYNENLQTGAGMPKRTFQPNRRRRAKTHGFRARMKSPGAGPRAAILSPSVPNDNVAPAARFCLPKQARLLKSAEYRRIYQEGTKWVGPLFAAFYRRAEGGPAAQVGFTTPRALGPAVARNRIKRRLREAVRVQLPKLGRGDEPRTDREADAGWEIVFNPRRALLDAEFARISGEVARLFGVLRQKAVRSQKPA
jgi:ribonuclease P protein component